MVYPKQRAAYRDIVNLLWEIQTFLIQHRRHRTAKKTELIFISNVTTDFIGYLDQAESEGLRYLDFLSHLLAFRLVVVSVENLQQEDTTVSSKRYQTFNA